MLAVCVIQLCVKWIYRDFINTPYPRRSFHLDHTLYCWSSASMQQTAGRRVLCMRGVLQIFLLGHAAQFHGSGWVVLRASWQSTLWPTDCLLKIHRNGSIYFVCAASSDASRRRQSAPNVVRGGTRDLDAYSGVCYFRAATALANFVTAVPGNCRVTAASIRRRSSSSSCRRYCCCCCCCNFTKRIIQ